MSDQSNRREFLQKSAMAAAAVTAVGAGGAAAMAAPRCCASGKPERKAVVKKVKSAKAKHSEKYPPDLVKVVGGWCRDLPVIIGKLETVAAKKEYAEYIVERDPKVAAQFRSEIKRLAGISAQLESLMIPRLKDSE